MIDPQAIRKAVGRMREAVTRRPAVGQFTQVMHCRIDGEGSCAVEEDGEKLTIGMSPEFGGPGGTPGPGFYGRAALASCIAQGYVVFAADLKIPLNSVEVELHSNSDMRGHLGIDPSVPVSYVAMHYVAHLDSPAPREKLEELAAMVDARDWVLDSHKRAIPMTHELRVSDAAGDAGAGGGHSGDQSGDQAVAGSR